MIADFYMLCFVPLHGGRTEIKMNILRKQSAVRLGRILAFALAAMITAAALSAVSAEEIYAGDFIKCRYTLYEKREAAAKSYDIADFPMSGKTEISFDFTPQNTDLCSFNVQNYGSADKTEILRLRTDKTDGGFLLATVNAMNDECIIADGIEENKEYCAVIQLDLNESVYNITVYENHSRNRLVSYKRGLAMGGSFAGCGLKSTAFFQTAENFAVYRERAAKDKPITDIKNEIVSVGTEISENINAGDVCDVFAAFYSADRSKLIAVEKQEYTHKGFDSYAEVFFGLDENFKSDCPVSVFVFKNDSMYPASKNGIADISQSGISVKNALAYTGFEKEETYKNTSAVTGGKLPEKWSANGWNGAASPFDITVCDGGYLALGAVKKGFDGICSPWLSLPENGLSISFKVKCSEDYDGNTPRIVLLYYDENNKFKGSDFTFDYTYSKNVSADVWKNEQLYVNPESYPDGAAKVSVAFCTSYAFGASGQLYYDSLCIDDCVFNMQCDEKLSWYSLGDTVKYTLKYPVNGKISEICGRVYNSDNEPIDEVSLSLKEVSENGWTYTPKQSGFYRVVFSAVTEDNRVIYESMKYKANYSSTTQQLYYIDREYHDFYVTSFNNPDISERNKLYGMSIANYDGDYDLDIADRLGMSFVRLHAFSWKDIEPDNVTEANGKAYNWSDYDKIFNRIRNELDFDVIGNILYTPKWASPVKDESGGLVPRYARYAPEDMTYLTDFLHDLYARYGDLVDTWEIYNEPHLPGGSTFWSDSAENYVNMLKSAYDTLKSKSGGNDTVTMGGIGAKRYLSFYRQFLEKGGWQYTDKLAMHGYDLDPWNCFDVNSRLGLDSNKGVINTEAHTILFNGSSSDIYFTEKQLGLRLIKDYLRQIKYGVEKIAFFQPYDNSVQGSDCMILDNMTDKFTTVAAGIFRKLPYYEPRFAAGVLNTLISVSGTDTSYREEYKTGNVNIVKLACDGKPLYILWGDELDAANAADIRISENASVLDWEGRSIGTGGFTVCADTVYFISGLDENAFSYLSRAGGEHIYDGAVLYSENEVNKKSTDGLNGEASYKEIFSHDGNRIANSGITWNTISESADFTVHKCSDGFDCMVRTVSGDAVKAQLVIGIDTFANGIASDVVEITGVLSKSGGTITKTLAPDICGDMPSDDYSGSGETVNGALGFAADEGNYTYYCMHIPFTQLYPYFYREDGKISFGLKLAEYGADNVEKGKYVWGKTYNRARPWEFGTVQLAEKFTGNIIKTVSAKPGEYVSAEILKDGDVVYYNMYTAPENGECTVFAALDCDGVYTLRTYSDSGGYTETDFIYTLE